ncbi:MAG TPA: RidA family protein [Dongiaceae bacterium]|jgi:enamine deaminase RidA (YjgF/YER057c/UK114 family)|nr:RidA family protein [Dongiaceae bacterium]
MNRRLISSGSRFEKEYGYSRAIVDGEWIFVSGCTGYDYATMTISEDPAEQTHRCFMNIAAALKEAGASLADIVRVRAMVTNRAHWEKVGPILGQYLGEIRPANTTVICELIDPQMKVEIEVTARKPGGSDA